MNKGRLCRKEAATLVAVVAWSLLVVFACDDLPRETEPRESTSGVTGQVMVVAEQSLLRTEASVEAKVVSRVARGAEFAITGSSRGWVKVSLEGGGEGWLPEAELGVKVNRSGRVCIEMGLKDAIELGGIEADFRGTGASSGDAVLLRGEGALTVAVCPRFQRGSVIQNANAAAQGMVLRRLRGRPSGNQFMPEVELRFEPGIEVEYLFEAFCLDFSKDNPSEEDRLVLGEPVREEVALVLAVEGADIEAVQLAVWAITDDITVAQAREVFGTSDRSIEDARRLVREAGLEVSSYRLFASGG